MSKTYTYTAKIRKQKEGGYTVKFPDLPEAITQGESLGKPPLKSPQH